MKEKTGVRRRPYRDHPLAPLASISWAASLIYGLILLPIEGLGPIPWGSAVAWLFGNFLFTAWIFGRNGEIEDRLPRAGEREGFAEGESLLGRGLRRLRQNQMALVSAGILLGLLLLCFGQSAWNALGGPQASGGGALSLHLDPTRIHRGEELRPPDGAHWFGTDALGRDLFARVLRGGAVSFSVGIIATLVSLAIGIAWGSVAGYAGGRVDNALMRIVDVLYGLPFLFLVILILSLTNGLHLTAARMGPVLERWEELRKAGELEAAGRLAAENEISSIASVRAAVFLDRHVDPLVAMFVALGLVQWLTMARIVRGQVLSIREREFIAALRTMGAGAGRIIFRHILPNILGPVIVDATLTVPAVMLAEAFLSFLGLGVSEPEASWGSLAAKGLAGVNAVKPCWWLMAYPAGAISLALFSLNFLGDGLRDALDPRAKGRS